MSITKEQKAEIVKEFGNGKDAGCPEVQVAIFTQRIINLTEHMKENHKDFSTRRGLMMLVGKRRRALDYLKSKDEAKYLEIIKKLNIRK